MNNSQAKEMENLLNEKYGIDFKVTHIGGRYGTANNDTVSTYAHPTDNERLSFKAVMYKNQGGLVSDGFIPRLMSNSINQILQKELQKQGIESESHTFMMGANSSSETNPDISLEEYLQKYQPEYLSGDLVVKHQPDMTPELFEDALQTLYSAIGNRYYQVRVYVISEDNYGECSENFRKTFDVSEQWFNDYGLVDKMQLIIDNEGFRVWKKSE